MNASDIVADRLITRGLYLERYKSGLNNRIIEELEQLEDGLTRELASAFAARITNQSTKIRRLEALLIDVRGIVREVYRKADRLSGTELVRLARNEQTYVVAAINEATVIETAFSTLDYEQLKKLTDGTLIEGAPSREWWKRQGEDLTKRFSDQVRMGVMRSEPLDLLVARVRGTRERGFTDGAMQATRRQAQALVRTSVQSVANGARNEVFAANPEVVSAIRWLSTLDSQTTAICMALSGKRWTVDNHKPIGHTIPYPGPTAHFACRSTQTAVLKSWDDLLKDQDEEELDAEFKKQLAEQGFGPDEIATIKRNTRASMDGQVPADITFDAWLNGKPATFQDQMLGKGRGKLFRDGKITLTDLVDQRLRPLSIEQLEELSQPRPRAKVVRP